MSDLLARGGSGAENVLGTPAWTVATAASLQAGLAVRCLLGRAGPEQPALVFDLADGSFTAVRL